MTSDCECTDATAKLQACKRKLIVLGCHDMEHVYRKENQVKEAKKVEEQKKKEVKHV